MKNNQLQIVCVKWGKKYSHLYVNAIVDEVLAHTEMDVSFVCFTDDEQGISDKVSIRPFPDFGVPIESMTNRGGSLPKMSMLIEGELKTGVPTLYIDLDSSIMGDIATLVDCLKKKRALYFLQRHAIPHWRIRGLVRYIAPQRYYLGNTAVMAFYVEDWQKIAEQFMLDFPVYLSSRDTMDPIIRRLYDEGNERIISHAARDVSRVFPADIAIKFTQEYMAPFLWMALLKDRLPWVKRRRSRQPVISYQGDELKPIELIKARPGDLITYKHYKTRWSYDHISQYWKRLIG